MLEITRPASVLLARLSPHTGALCGHTPRRRGGSRDPAEADAPPGGSRPAGTTPSGRDAPMIATGSGAVADIGASIGPVDRCYGYGDDRTRQDQRGRPARRLS